MEEAELRVCTMVFKLQKICALYKVSVNGNAWDSRLFLLSVSQHLSGRAERDTFKTVWRKMEYPYLATLGHSFAG